MGRRNNGAINQSAMIENTSIGRFERQMFFPVRGIIDGVRFKNKNGGLRTFIDVYCFNDYPVLRNVPILHGKINKDNGEDWTPEKGDMVAVQFFGGDIKDPVISGYIPPPENSIEAQSTEAPRSYRKRSGTFEEIDKDGNRTVHVAAGDSLNVVGSGTVVIGGAASETVVGNKTTTAPTVIVNASSKVQFNTPELNVTGKIISGGNMESGAVVKAVGNVEAGANCTALAGQVQDSAGTMAAVRTIYNGHDHDENGDGGGTTDPPNQGM